MIWIGRIAELAGVSQGAQTHHFPRRVDLVGVAVEHPAARRISEAREPAAELPEAPSQRVLAAAAKDLVGELVERF